MAKLYLKKASKRQPLRKKYKILRKVREHKRKVKKEARKNPKKAKKDTLHIPNLCPFKEELLLEMQRAKKQKEEEKRFAKDALRNAKLTGKVEKIINGADINTFIQSAGRRLKNHEDGPQKQPNEMEEDRADKKENMQKFQREFRKVVAESNVILQVLDARDPFGTRSKQVEEYVLQHADKRLVFILNKADLIPRDNLNVWLKHLRQFFPTVPFKSSTQQQRRHLSQKKSFKQMKKDSAMEGSTAVGTDLLMSLLANYCRNKDVKTSITVGVVGMPNVGKSSLINSLKRSRSCEVGATPGVTKIMQPVQLDSKIKLLDCPGVVYGCRTTDGSSCNALKNVVRVEKLDDPLSAATSILRRVTKEHMMQQYALKEYSSPEEFFCNFSRRLGFYKKGGIPDMDKAARSLINDWNRGKIKYYTVPPEDNHDVHLSAEIVQTMAKEFNIDDFESMETNVIASIEEPQDSALAIDVPEEMTTDSVESNAAPKCIKINKKKRNGKKKKANDNNRKHDAELSLEGNQKLNAMKKLDSKKKKKDKARRDKEATKLADAFESVSLGGQVDDTYNFSTDFSIK